MLTPSSSSSTVSSSYSSLNCSSALLSASASTLSSSTSAGTSISSPPTTSMGFSSGHGNKNYEISGTPSATEHLLQMLQKFTSNSTSPRSEVL
ncbi:hypothetical protein DOY81_013902 [Sarcophaga bullata]|nr:hypothetical protein DOY81_013902 [Sarcophaga bullata]